MIQKGFRKVKFFNLTFRYTRKMHLRIYNDKNRVSFTLLMILFAAFFVLKMNRTFLVTDTEGGIWNYLQIFFIFGGMLSFFRWGSILQDKQILFLLLYTFFSVFHSLNSVSLTRNSLFSYVMITYPLFLLVLMNGQHEPFLYGNKILVVAYYVIAAIFCFSMLSAGSYSTLTGAVSDAYYVLGLLPLVLCYQKRMQWIPILVSGITLLISGKRAGLLAYIVMMVCYYLIELSNTTGFLKRLRNLLIIFVVVIILFFIFQKIIAKFNLGLLLRLENLILRGDDSGRSIRWKMILSAMKDSSLFSWIFGHGMSSVSHTIGGNAHNDFLEILFNYGVVPFLMYSLFAIKTFTKALRMIREKYHFAAQYLMSAIFSLFLASFSFYFITPTYVTCGMMCLGLINSDYLAEKNKERP